MKGSIAGRVRNTNLPKSKALLPLFEGVINAFQAIDDAGGKNHKIRIGVQREGDLHDEQAARLESFSIEDTGVGFNDANYESFDTVDSPYKAGKGGKGLGRFLWLKAFDRVEIDSHFNDFSGKLARRKLTFELKEDTPKTELVEVNKSATGTFVRLLGFKEPYRSECPRSLETIAQRLVAHFLPLFLNAAGPSVFLTDGAEEIDVRDFYRKHFEAFSTRHTFVVGDQSFTLDGFRLQGAVADHHELVYGADYREVITERLGRLVPNLKGKLSDPERGQFAYLAFVQSPFLNSRVNNERTEFLIPKESAKDQTGDGQSGLFSEVSIKDIRDAAVGVISRELKPFLDEINQAKQAAVESYIAEDAPQYRVLMKYKDEFIDKISPGASKNEIDAALHNELHERQVRLKREGEKILSEAALPEDSDAYYERLQKFVKDENEIGKTALAQYVVHRRVILELLQKALSQDPESGDYALEKAVHGLVFPMRSTSDDVPFEQQNLWIIDERLTFHSFLSSDIRLDQLAQLENSSESRPDLLIFNHPLAFTEDGEPLQSMVVIEFKKPSRSGYSDEDPITQVYRMVREIREGKRKDHKGVYIRPSNANVPAYCYILCDLTPSVEIKIQNMGARRTPDNLGYYGFNETLNAYFELISYRKLLNDAQKRNRILFEKLNLPPQSRS